MIKSQSITFVDEVSHTSDAWIKAVKRIAEFKAENPDWEPSRRKPNMKTRNQRKAWRKNRKLSRHARPTSVPYQTYEIATDLFLDRQGSSRSKRVARRLKRVEEMVRATGRSIPELFEETSLETPEETPEGDRPSSDPSMAP